MKNKKYVLLVLLFLVCILSISAISAADNTTKQDVISADNNKESNVETFNQYDDVSNSKENVELKEENNTDEVGGSKTDKTTADNAELSFKDLNTTINGNTNSTIYLSNNYKYNSVSDNNFKNGILINRKLTIYGNGVTIDGSNLARIFNVTGSDVNVEFHNITFINGNSSKIAGAIYGGNAYNCNFINNTVYNYGYGGAIAYGNAYNCTFIDNKAHYGGAIAYGNAYNCTFNKNKADYNGGAIAYGNASNCIFINNTANDYGGAIIKGNAYNCLFTNNNASGYGGAMCSGRYDVQLFNAYNCTFINNSATGNESTGGAIFKVNAYNCTFNNNNATLGQAMYKGSAILCIFNGDSTEDTTIIPATINVINYTSPSGERLKFNLTANGTLYDGFNTTINIYKDDGSLVKTVYALTGEGWIVDLENGTYTAVLSLTDYPNENSTNATITVGRVNTYIVINPIDAKVGQEVTINYTTNSNGTVTIKINGTTITGGKFTPPASGTYNLTIEIAENDYYTAGYNETTFTAERTNTTVVINPIADVLVGEEVLINYTINSNGTVTVKVNGTPINGANFTPTKEGIYNITIEVAENDYYTAGYNETTFTAERTNTTVVINPIADVLVGEEVLINYTINSNGTVTVKVNGTPINGANFTPTKEGIYNITIEVAENDYYTAGYNETTFTAERTNTTVVINPIADVLVGEEVLINYTINSNGTVTVKVNGTPINGANFTPTKEGIYNITIEVAENDYYTAGYNETTFTAERTNTTVVINPIADVLVGEEVLINYTINSNGTVTVKVNGTPINGANFTPTKEGIYNITIEVAENDYYTAGYNETTFTAERTNTTVVINPIADVLVGEEVLINYTINSNGTVTVKVNGTPINGANFTPTKEGIYNITIEVAENDYYTAGYNETTFTAERTNTTVVIDPIMDTKAGKEIIINYTTNSNGTVTIKVNGDVIADGKFTPPTNGTYNVTIEVAENDYYTAATNETTFKVKKMASTIIANPVTTNYNLDKYLTITLKDEEGKPITGGVLTVKILGISKKYTTDSNGQVKIKVSTLGPKTYHPRIKYEGSNQFKASSALVKVTVKKATPKITAKSKNFKVKPVAKKYTITLKNQNKVIKNKKVTLKVKGKTYTGKTNSKGQATFKIRNLNKKGTYNAVITVTGNHYYNQVSKKVKINVKP